MATKTDRTKLDSATEEIYKVICEGLRSYIARKLGEGYSEDEMHEVVSVIAAQAVREGNLRDPKRLMEYVRTVVRNGVTVRIREINQRRRDHCDRVLHALAPRDQEILARFYIREQSPDQICSEMGLTQTQYRLCKSRATQRFAAA